MGRWSHLDTDEERLPDGMTRIGYDADTQIYTYRDSDGSTWEGAPGNQYGKLFRVKTPPAAPSPRDIFLFPLGHGVKEEDDDYVLHDPDEPTDSDDSTLAAKLGIVPPEKAKLASEAHNTSNKQPPYASKPLPPLPGDDSKEWKDDDSYSLDYSDDDLEKPAPKGEEHRHRREMNREMNRKQEGTMKRASTISRIARFIRRPSASGPPSPAGEGVRRSATVRDGQGTAARKGSRGRAKTFDEMLGPQNG